MTPTDPPLPEPRLPDAKFCPAGYAVPLAEVRTYADARATHAVKQERARVVALVESWLLSADTLDQEAQDAVDDERDVRAGQYAQGAADRARWDANMLRNLLTRGDHEVTPDA